MVLQGRPKALTLGRAADLPLALLQAYMTPSSLAQRRRHSTNRDDEPSVLLRCLPACPSTCTRLHTCAGGSMSVDRAMMDDAYGKDVVPVDVLYGNVQPPEAMQKVSVAVAEKLHKVLHGA